MYVEVCSLVVVDNTLDCTATFTVCEIFVNKDLLWNQHGKLHHFLFYRPSCYAAVMLITAERMTLCIIFFQKH